MLNKIDKKYDFPDLKYDNFIVPIVWVNYSHDFYEKYNNEQRFLIYDSIIEAFRDLLPSEYITNILPIENSRLCIVINLQYGSTQQIANIFRKVSESLNKNTDVYQIYIGIGSIL